MRTVNFWEAKIESASQEITDLEAECNLIRERILRLQRKRVTFKGAASSLTKKLRRMQMLRSKIPFYREQISRLLSLTRWDKIW